MKFFIVTPVYNAVNCLRGCIDSVRTQAGAGVHVHHHVQDGGSTDGTVEFLKEYAARHSSLATPAYTFSYSSERDAGMYDAINKGWDRADSSFDWFAWLNADEQYLPGALRLVSDFVRQHQNFELITGNSIIVRPDGTYMCTRCPTPAWGGMGRVWIPAQSCSLFFNDEFIRVKKLRFDARFKCIGDRELLLDAQDMGARFGYMRHCLALFTHSDSNLGYSATYSEEAREYPVKRRLSPMQRRKIPLTIFMAKCLRVLRYLMRKKMEGYHWHHADRGGVWMNIKKECLRYPEAREQVIKNQKNDTGSN